MVRPAPPTSCASRVPGSTVVVPPSAVWALVLIGLGGLLLCLWQGRGRWLGLIPLGVGLLQLWLAVTPHVLVNETAEVLAVRGQDGQLVLSPGRREGFTRGVWVERWGRSANDWSSLSQLACDGEGCLYDTDHGRAALAYTEAAVSEDCNRIAIMIARVPSWCLCAAEHIVIDRFDVWRHGAHAVWLNADGVTVKRVSDVTGLRVWNKTTWRLPNSAN